MPVRWRVRSHPFEEIRRTFIVRFGTQKARFCARFWCFESLFGERSLQKRAAIDVDRCPKVICLIYCRQSQATSLPSFFFGSGCFGGGSFFSGTTTGGFFCGGGFLSSFWAAATTERLTIIATLNSIFCKTLIYLTSFIQRNASGKKESASAIILSKPGAKTLF